AGRTMILLVVILSAGRLVSAGRALFLMVAMDYAAGSVYTLVDPFLLIGFVYAVYTSIYAVELVCAGSIMFLLANLLLLVVHLVLQFLTLLSPLQQQWILLVHMEVSNDFFLTSDFAGRADCILFRGQYISGDGVVVVDMLADDEIVVPRVKVENCFDYASSPPRSRRKHRGVRSDDFLWDKPVEDFFSSESESDDDMANYIPPLPYGGFKDWEISLHSDDVEDFWRTQDEWIVSSWKLYPKSSVHVLDLTNGKTVYMFVDRVYPIRATLLERMLRHKLTVPPSYCRDVVIAGNIIQTVQDGLRQAYECLAFAALCYLYKEWSSPRGKEWNAVFFDAAISFDSAVHRVHAVSFNAAVLDAAAPVSAAFVPAGSSSSVPADYVSAGHVLVL
ncbi:hypothetical protein Tco_0737755, partial [Tanacetum coccineum]